MYEERAWSDAVDGFVAADQRAPLDGDDLVLLARAAWWLSDLVQTLDALERAYSRLPAAARDDGTGRIGVALTLALLHMVRGDLTSGAAWMRRASRELDASPPGPLHARLLYLEASMGLDESGEAWSADSVERMRVLAGASADPSVAAFAAVAEGMAAVREGRVAVGFDRLDEAMLCVLAGDVEPEWASDILCTVIHTCHELADYQRMADWTRATESWSRRHSSDGVLIGVCRVHRLELRCARGEWDAAEQSLAAVCTDIAAVNTWVTAEGWYQYGELRRLRGDADGALDAYGEARRAGIEPLPGEALLALDAGDRARAWNLLADSLAARDRLSRARLLRPAVEVAIATDRLEQAAALAAELADSAAEYGTPGLRAWSEHAKGMVALARGDADAAGAGFLEADRLFRHLGLRWDRARVRAWRAAAHDLDGDADAADHCRAEAEALFLDLGAVPALQVVLPDRAAPGPLTAREREILELVADGATNRDAAARLFISEKTVSRHLANIYLKIGVGSRTAAAAWLRAERARR
ncbi:LuxR C-terminal-related transcriptional regulator [Microbacterium sp. NPDC057407]|uniref:LuxR C-terminal-related transcriptional regulator n=1 Tax=Microbacterium sp. NPDC057407 TaxID=3346120 RepID=UPI00366E0AA3